MTPSLFAHVRVRRRRFIGTPGIWIARVLIALRLRRLGAWIVMRLIRIEFEKDASG